MVGLAVPGGLAGLLPAEQRLAGTDGLGRRGFTLETMQNVFNANRNLSAYEAFGVPVWPDGLADFAGPLRSALATLHDHGCALPLRAVTPGVPPADPGPPSSLDQDEVLRILGRTLEVFPGTVLLDPAADPLAVARPDGLGGEPLRVVARQLDGSATVPEASWIAVRADEDSAEEDLPADARFLDVEPIMVAAGWHHPEPAQAPASLTDRGTLVRFVNRTGLIAGETTLGDELTGLYTAAEIARSALAGAALALARGPYPGAVGAADLAPGDHPA